MKPAQGLYDPRYEHDACGVGFVVDVKGRKSNAIINQALTVLRNLHHRGACGCEKNTGDGAGILIQMPHAFLAQACKSERIDLPGPGEYGVGMIYLPRDPAERYKCEKLFERIFSSLRNVVPDSLQREPRSRRKSFQYSRLRRLFY